MINKIWIFLIIIGISISFITGEINNLGDIILQSSKKGFEVFLNVGLLIIFWSGIFNIAIKSDLIKIITHIFKKPLIIIFPMIKEDAISLEYISSNIVANLLGLGSAATPLGLKAMKSLNENNPNPEATNRSMMILVLLNASAPTILPTTIFGLRSLIGASTSTKLFLLMIGLSIFSCGFGLLLERVFYLICGDKS